MHFRYLLTIYCGIISVVAISHVSAENSQYYEESAAEDWPGDDDDKTYAEEQIRDVKEGGGGGTDESQPSPQKFPQLLQQERKQSEPELKQQQPTQNRRLHPNHQDLAEGDEARLRKRATKRAPFDKEPRQGAPWKIKQKQAGRPNFNPTPDKPEDYDRNDDDENGDLPNYGAKKISTLASIATRDAQFDDNWLYVHALQPSDNKDSKGGSYTALAIVFFLLLFSILIALLLVYFLYWKKAQDEAFTEKIAREKVLDHASKVAPAEIEPEQQEVKRQSQESAPQPAPEPPGAQAVEEATLYSQLSATSRKEADDTLRTVEPASFTVQDEEGEERSALRAENLLAAELLASDRPIDYDFIFQSTTTSGVSTKTTDSSSDTQKTKEVSNSIDETSLYQQLVAQILSLIAKSMGVEEERVPTSSLN